jgi:ubiquinone/menaquinone biosynthesis C-methylase UbiE
MAATLKERVREYWQQEPCGTGLARAEPGTSDFFAQVEQARHTLEPFIPGFADFTVWRGKRILEIGVGLGTDFVQFVRAGADATGVDLTDAAVANVARRLELEGLEAELQVADAEALSFADATFDLVYSWGVLHHTPNTARALDEVRRVVKPGGEARLMLYSRRSWVALGLWLRYAVLAGRPDRSFAWAIANHMESAGTKAYTQRELEGLFEPRFAHVEYTRFRTPYDRKLGGPLVDLLSERWGWFVGIRARPR